MAAVHARKDEGQHEQANPRQPAPPARLHAPRASHVCIHGSARLPARRSRRGWLPGARTTSPRLLRIDHAADGREQQHHRAALTSAIATADEGVTPYMLSKSEIEPSITPSPATSPVDRDDRRRRDREQQIPERDMLAEVQDQVVNESKRQPWNNPVCNTN
jgi:hypothetical protein